MLKHNAQVTVFRCTSVYTQGKWISDPEVIEQKYEADSLNKYEWKCL